VTAVVGTHSCSSLYGETYPSVWTDPTAQPQRLPLPVGTSTNAFAAAVNDRGEIAGTATVAGDYRPHVLLWRPRR
jgi:hypothetical protein